MTTNDGTKLIKKGESKNVIERPDKLYKLMIESERMEVNIAELDPGAESRWFQHNGEEIHLVIEGKLDYTVGKNTYKLTEGDILWHESDLRHRAKNVSKSKVIYLNVGTPPTFKIDMA